MVMIGLFSVNDVTLVRFSVACRDRQTDEDTQEDCKYFVKTPV
jgi:hypothetical protein